MQETIDSCWSVFKWALVALVVAAAVAVPYAFRRFDEGLRRQIEATFAAHYPHLQVRVRSAELVEGEGILVRGVSVVEPGAEGPRAEILAIEEVFLACTTDLTDLLVGSPEVTHVVFRRPTLRVTRRRDGTYNITRLFPLPELGEHSPRVVVEQGRMEVFDPTRSPAGMLTFRDVHLACAPGDESEADSAGETAWSIQGMFTGDHLREAEIAAVVEPDAGRWAAQGRLEGLLFTPDFRGALPTEAGESLAALDGLRAECGTVAFRVAYDPQAAEPWDFAARGEIVHGRVDDRRLPRPLTDVRAAFRIDPEAVTLDDFTARAGQATLRFSGRRLGWGPHAPLALAGEVRQLDVDAGFREMLPPNLREAWNHFLPAGLVRRATVRLTFDGVCWQPQFTAQCAAISLTYHRFPYRLEEGEGTITLRDDRFTADLMMQSGQHPVRILVDLEQATTAPRGWSEVSAPHLPLDEKLFLALEEPARGVYRALDPSGVVDVYARFELDGPETPPRRYVRLMLHRGGLRFAGFPYPLSNLSGTLELRGEDWEFRNLHAASDTGRVWLDGRWTAADEGGVLALKVTGRNVALGDDLRGALSPPMQRAWGDLRPQGYVDLDADIHYVSADRDLTLAVDLRPQPETVSIEPVHFPYRLDRMEGEFTYRDGQLRFRRVRGRHGRTAVAMAGACDFGSDGSWHLTLSDLSVDRLHADHSLLQALPEGLRSAVAGLNPTGPMGLRGEVQLVHSGEPGTPLFMRWDLTLGFHQLSIDAGIPLENLHGEVTLVGQSDGHTAYSRGELNIDSLIYKDVQLTQVQGPLWIDRERVLLGTWVDQPRYGAPQGPRSSRPPRPVRGRLFGGALEGSGWVTLGRKPGFELHATLTQADLARVSQEMVTGSHPLRATVFAEVTLHGSGRSLNTLGGRGRIHLSDADIYKLPLMISLLKILSIREPDRSAFSKSDIEFHVDGNHIYFDRINFNGDAISLLGQGEMNLQQDVRLAFYAVVGRDELRIPIIREVLGGASQQIMLIHVDGPLQNPQVRREAFPAVNQALQHLQSELATPPPLLPEARRLPPIIRQPLRR